jgi:hypothetical protein
VTPSNPRLAPAAGVMPLESVVEPVTVPSVPSVTVMIFAGFSSVTANFRPPNDEMPSRSSEIDVRSNVLTSCGCEK